MAENKEQVPIAAIVTANSNSGSSCVDELFSKYAGKVRVRAVFRSEDKAADFRAKYGARPDVESVVVGVDAANPATLGAAFNGAQLALIVTPHDPVRGMQDDVVLNTNLINAAIAGGVKHITWVGSWTVHPGVVDRAKDISGRFAPIEKLFDELAGAGKVQFTALRAGWFCDNTAALASQIQAGNVVHFVKFVVPPVATRDIGKSAARVIADHGVGHEGKHYEISGPVRITTEQIVQKIGQALGRELQFNGIPAQALQGKVPGFLYDLVLYLADVQEEAVPVADHVQQLTGQHTTFDEWLALGGINLFKAGAPAAH